MRMRTFTNLEPCPKCGAHLWRWADIAAGSVRCGECNFTLAAQDVWPTVGTHRA